MIYIILPDNAFPNSILFIPADVLISVDLTSNPKYYLYIKNIYFF